MQSYPCAVKTQTLRRAIKKLPADVPIQDPAKWYTTQKQHWLGWLGQYSGAGAYGRKTDVKRDAKYAYNHIVEYKMLTYLAEAIEIDADLLDQVSTEIEGKTTLMEKSGIVRKHIPWDMVAYKLWPDPEIHSQSFLTRLYRRYSGAS